MRQRQVLFAFNRGRISPLGLARIDQKRVVLGAETMTNYVPRVLGSMSLRPGWQYLTGVANNNAPRGIPFVFRTSDTAIIEITNLLMRVLVDDAPVARPTVSTTITNGAFDTDLSGWTDDDESGATSAWVSGGYMGLTGSGTAAAIRKQQVTVGTANVEHGLRVSIERGPIILRVGSTDGGDEYIAETTLLTGTHSLAFTPTGDFWIQFENRNNRQLLVNSVSIESDGHMTIAVPWGTSDLDKIRYSQSADVVFVACDGYLQRRIERRGTRSWSIVQYEPEDGPYRIENVTGVTLTPSALTGNITLTASAPVFKSTNSGSLYRLVSEGQTVSLAISAENTFTGTVEITGVGNARGFAITTTGTWTATLTLQRSFDDGASWLDVESYTTNQSKTFTDVLDNQIVLYRIGIKTGDYTSGTVTATLSFSSGSITGHCRVTGFVSETEVQVEVLKSLGATTATDNWSEGEWSERRGYPTAVALHDGRLWWGGRGGIWGSASDAFDSFDQDIEGDSGPINRDVGSGPVDNVNWLLPLQRLVLGAEGGEFSIKSSSDDIPITPSNFNIKQATTESTDAVDPIRVNQRGIFVQGSGIRVYELGFDPEGYDYSARDLTVLVPEMGSPGISRMAVQRQPDTRIHCVRSDGTVMLGIIDRTEDIIAWFDITTDGLVKDVVVLPGASGSTEDKVYYAVQRTINGSSVTYWEKWASETECRGATLNKQADSFLAFSGPTTVVTGLSHLEGESVVVWADGKDLGDYTVSSGQITLPEIATSGIVGLGYTAQWKSTKIGLSPNEMFSVLGTKKHVSHIGLVMAWVHAKGIKFGPDFSNLDDLPEIEAGTEVGADTVRTTYDEQEIEFPSTWVTDGRLCLQSEAPRPCTVLAVVANMEAG